MLIINGKLQMGSPEVVHNVKPAKSVEMGEKPVETAALEILKKDKPKKKPVNYIEIRKSVKRPV